MKNIFLEKYFELLISNINTHLNDVNFPEEEKAKLQIRIELINELKYSIDWQIKSPIQKQAHRISSLASMRKTDALPHFIKKQETAIYIYEKIQYTIPYLLALNHNVNQIIIDFTNEICDKIDFAGSNYRGDFPGNEEVQNVFNNFIQFQKPAQGNGGMFKESYEKIEELYVALIKLNETK